MPKLGVNIDHVATLRQARGESEPDPVSAALICEKAGADSIVCHLREDRRHINDDDVRILRKVLKKRFNLEMSINPAIVKFALKTKPDQVTLVPERRQEITTEGGLDVIKYFSQIRKINRECRDRGITVSLFIAANKKQIDKTLAAGISMVEFHTGKYANARTQKSINAHLKNLSSMTRYANRLGITVNAGHGLKYHNTKEVARIKGMEELNIGHSIVSRSVFIGLENAVKEMKAIVRGNA